jgi:hypothetical protein
MHLSMKVFIPILSIITGLLLLMISCQQTNTGESKSHWQLSSPPGTAAGYGRSPLDTSDAKDTSSVPPAGENVQQETTAPAGNESTLQQPERENDVPVSSAPTLKIEPPPSAAGYGRPLQDPEDRKESSPPSSDDSNPSKTTPTLNEPATKQPESLQPSSGGYGPGTFTPTWTIEPPPSAAGYGK